MTETKIRGIMGAMGEEEIILNIQNIFLRKIKNSYY